MTFDGPWAWSIIKGQYPEAEINFALVPQGKGGSRSVVGGEDIVIFNSTKYKEESWEFVKYMTSKEVQLKFATVGQMPVLKGLLDEPEIKVHLFFPVYLEQLETAVARSPHPAWNEINDIMDSAWQNSVIGGVDPKKSLDNAAKEIEKKFFRNINEVLKRWGGLLHRLLIIIGRLIHDKRKKEKINRFIICITWIDQLFCLDLVSYFQKFYHEFI